MTKTYVQIQKQIETLQREADKLKRKEVDDVIAKIKEAIRVYGLTADDLSLDTRAAGARRGGVAKKRGGPRRRASRAVPPPSSTATSRAIRGAAAARVPNGCATRSAPARRCRTSPSERLRLRLEAPGHAIARCRRSLIA
jgi:DNA-binding protein H-NS